MKKFELTEIQNERGLRRIRALKDIPRYGINAGNLGGFVEYEDNLTHDGDCWVSDDAWVYQYAQISGNTRIYGDARISGSAQVSGGVWKTSPLVINGSVHSLYPTSPSTIKIGCEEHPIEYWLENYVRIGEEYGYTPDQIDEYDKHLKHVANWIKSMKRLGFVED